MESLAKAGRASERGDGKSVRLFARNVALLAPRLLGSINEEVVVRNRREALEAALSFRIAPEHYRKDASICLGLVAAGDEAVRDAALRLGRELLAFIRERKPDVDDQPDIAGYLADGTLERHLGFRTD